MSSIYQPWKKCCIIKLSGSQKGWMITIFEQVQETDILFNDILPFFFM